MKNSIPWNKGKMYENLPMPFVIPKGYKSGFTDVAVGLNHLWKCGKGTKEQKWLQQFHKKQKKNTFGTLLGENQPEGV